MQSLLIDVYVELLLKGIAEGGYPVIECHGSYDKHGIFEDGKRSHQHEVFLHFVELAGLDRGQRVLLPVDDVLASARDTVRRSSSASAAPHDSAIALNTSFSGTRSLKPAMSAGDLHLLARRGEVPRAVVRRAEDAHPARLTSCSLNSSPIAPFIAFSRCSASRQM